MLFNTNGRAGVAVLSLVGIFAGFAPTARAQLDDNEDAKVERFWIYKDADTKNNGVWTNRMTKKKVDPNEFIKEFSEVDKANPAFGKTCIKANIKFPVGVDIWCGIAVASKADYWGIEPGPGFNLKKAKKLVWYARGAKGGEMVQFKLGIAGAEPFGDSTPIAPATEWLTLKKTWERYELPIDSRRFDMQRIITPFCFIVDTAHNRAEDVTLYLDHIYYIMEEGK